MFRSVDRLSAMVKLLRTTDGQPVNYEDVIADVQSLLRAAHADRPQATQTEMEQVLSEVRAACPATEESSSATAVDPPAGAAQPPSQATASTPPADCFAGIDDEADISDKYLSLFLDEAELGLEKMTGILLALESGGGIEELQKLLGIAHQIKGSAASVGLNRAARFAHVMEDLVQQVLDAGGRLPPPTINVMLRAGDGFHVYLGSLRRGEPETGPLAIFVEELLAARAAPAVGGDAHPGDTTCPSVVPGESQATPPPRGTPEEPQLPAELRDRVVACAPSAGPALFGEVRFQPQLAVAGLKAMLIHEKLTNLGDIFYFDPPPSQLDEMAELDSLRFGLVSETPAETLRSQLTVAGVVSVAVALLSEAETGAPPERRATRESAAAPSMADAGRRCAAPLPAADQPLPARAGDSRQNRAEKDRPSETVRVDTERLDHLMDLAGQLVTSKARFSVISDDLRSHLGGIHCARKLDGVVHTLERLFVSGGAEPAESHLRQEFNALRNQVGQLRNELLTLRGEMESYARARSSVSNLSEAVHQLDRVSAEIQQSVMATRMVPIGPLFNRFRRVVRDISVANRKEIRLVIRGEKTELDKRLIDELSDPLTHAIRNCADHGIESPEARAAAGKPSQGTVTLDAFHRGNSIVIQVSDDGKGLDTDRIIRKCLEKALLTEADAAKMTPRQIWQMIWAPGFSTAEKVTEVSGRGMGMDIVRTNIANLNGTVEMDSAVGQGTTLTIKLPITLAIVPSLMAEIQGDIFAVPMEAVKEIIQVPRSRILSIQGQPAVCVRDTTIMLRRLEELLVWHAPGVRPEHADREQVCLLIVGESGNEAAIPVDRVLGEDEVVIKSLAHNYKHVPGVAGAAVLGDGRVSLILDIPTLITFFSRNSTASRKTIARTV
jgi:two-component system chemotaxis sensor kinase CheA